MSPGSETTEGREELPRRGGQDDSFILQSLVWCAICDQPMTPTTTNDLRHYRCGNAGCPRRLILAEMVERVVWAYLVYVRPDLVEQVDADGRRDALEGAFSRVWVGRTVSDLYYDWRDE